MRVGRFYDIAVTIENERTYKNLAVELVPNTVQDKGGYIGQMHR